LSDDAIYNLQLSGLTFVIGFVLSVLKGQRCEDLPFDGSTRKLEITSLIIFGNIFPLLDSIYSLFICS
jgi:hypothetical protein